MDEQDRQDLAFEVLINGITGHSPASKDPFEPYVVWSLRMVFRTAEGRQASMAREF